MNNNKHEIVLRKMENKIHTEIVRLAQISDELVKIDNCGCLGDDRTTKIYMTLLEAIDSVDETIEKVRNAEKRINDCRKYIITEQLQGQRTKK